MFALPAGACANIGTGSRVETSSVNTVSIDELSLFMIFPPVHTSALARICPPWVDAAVNRSSALLCREPYSRPGSRPIRRVTGGQEASPRGSHEWSGSLFRVRPVGCTEITNQYQ